ncbi:MAG: GDP-mannose 4,6-dehydratase [bacterium]|nr:GDP-mannose 4,6-dehydratase [bacterium]
MKVLVTGGVGFVGVHLLPWLEHDSAIESVVILDSLCYTSIPSVLHGLSDKFKFIKGDICEVTRVADLVSTVDVVINLAAQTFVDNAINDSLPFVMTNIFGLASILEAIRKDKCRQRLVHISTDEVWGEALVGSFNEESPYHPRNPYSATKAAADHMIRAYGSTYGLRYNIIHFPNLYGRWQYPEKLIPATIARLSRDEKARIYGDGQQTRTWLHVNDAVDGLLRVFHHATMRTYTLGTDDVWTNLDVVKLICRLMGKDETSIEFVEDRLGHDRHYVVDCSRICQELNWRPTIKFEVGVADIIAWFKAHQRWWETAHQ